MHRLALAFIAALAAALAVVSLSAASHQRSRATRPHRIISLSPTITEDLFAIGAGRQVIAVDDQSNYPRRAPRTSLSGFTPNVEAIANYHPDLVLISYNPSGFASQLRNLGIKVVNIAAAENLKQAYSEILKLGRLTGRATGAKAVVQSMKTRLAAIIRSVPASRRHLRVYHELDQNYYTATSKTFIGSVYTLFGFKDIADAADTSSSGGYPQLSGEYIVQQNPQIIVLADTKCCQQTEATVASRPGWNTIAAVRHGRVVGIDDDVASRWGPRIVQFARAVARIARKG
ncbi:MAG TPA: ABC transporter substrate-binding protein [Gaiellaceae bacterium]|nr:ABC transporter substrate-binding protein [Gaiellaceae bacterium]